MCFLLGFPHDLQDDDDEAHTSTVRVGVEGGTGTGVELDE